MVPLANIITPSQQIIKVTICDSFLTRMRGLMFTESLPRFSGILIAQPIESRWDSAIHMFFMRYPILAVWLDTSYTVIDIQTAYPWVPAYIPSRPARYVLETHPDHHSLFNINDKVQIQYAIL